MRERQVSNSAHPVSGRPSGKMETGQAGHRIFGSRTSPAESGAFGQARCHRLRRSFGFGGVGQDRVSARELRTRHGPRASAHDHVRRNRGFGRGSCRTRIRELRFLKSPRQGRGTHVPNPPSGEPSGLRPCRGATGDTIRVSAPTDSGGCGARTCPGDRASKPPIANGPFRRTRMRRDSGGRRQRRPPLSFGSSGPGRVRGVHHFPGQSSCRRPVSWQRA